VALDGKSFGEGKLGRSSALADLSTFWSKKSQGRGIGKHPPRTPEDGKPQGTIARESGAASRKTQSQEFGGGGFSKFRGNYVTGAQEYSVEVGEGAAKRI